ncbi:diacylglycerol kinase [Occultella glacieicola]|uniref:Diacylglycerol kinase n=1 Tax=Occultella glacieicola TaxID=2518684 RepID=A0ABY2E0J0_9MICO|nr:diacylglycerol kinase family protein [Occultella glacieicola]TDE91464.1 diacylglycerol kinase [Occultella glacieicola]
MSESRAVVVHNPLKMSPARLARALAREESRAGWAASRLVATAPEESTDSLRERILAEPADVVIAVGGDGTVRATVEAVIGQSLPLGLWPVGTTNLAARNLGLSMLDPGAALRAAFGTVERAVDVGRLTADLTDGRRLRKVFVVLAGFGVDAQMVVHTSMAMKRQFGWLAYVDGVRRGVTRSDRFELTYSLDRAEPRAVRAHTFAIGNGGSLPAGLTLLPDAVIDDGELDVLLLRPEGASGWRDLARWFFTENGLVQRIRRTNGHRSDVPRGESVLMARTQEVRLTVRHGEDFQIDGEYLGKVVALRVVVMPGALRVRVPSIRSDSGPVDRR